MPAPAQNVATVRRLFRDGICGRDLDLIDALFAPTFRAAGGPGHAELRSYFSAWFAAFPDLHEEVVITLAQEDLVAATLRGTGTHRGLFDGRPPTGAVVSFTGAAVWRFENGRIVESWGGADRAAIHRQIDAAAAAEFRGPVSLKAVLCHDDRVLLVRNRRGIWELPGGKLQRGESHTECVARELREELQLEVETGPVVDTGPHPYYDDITVIVYGCHYVPGQRVVLSNEHSAVRLWPLDQHAEETLAPLYFRAARTWLEREQTG